MTLKELCQLGNIKLNKENKVLENKEIKSITNLIAHGLKGDRLYFDVEKNKISEEKLQDLLTTNTIIVTNKDYNFPAIYKKQLIKVENPFQNYYLIGQKLLEKYKIPTIGITGSVGKTTTTRLLNLVFKEKYKVFSTPITSNTPTYFIEEIYTKLKESYDIYIQETGGSRPKSVENAVKVLNPKAFILTNINEYHHLDLYKTKEALIEDKLSYDKVAHNAIGIINIDDKILSKHKYKNKIITYSLKNKKADYIAENIIQVNDNLKFDIIDNIHKKTIPIEINIVGSHNAYNILAVYALAKEFSISDEEILRGLAKYKTVTLRQEFKTIAGRKFYIDSFNVCSESIKTSLESLDKFKTANNEKRIAIIGGENAIGEKSYEVNFKTGTTFNKYNLDKIILVGPKEETEKEINLLGNGKALYDGAKTTVDNNKLLYYNDIDKLAEYLEKETKPGDLILIKGIFRLGLFAAIDLAFGTDIVYRHTYFTNNSEKISTNNFKGILIKRINKISLKEYIPTENTKVIIPDEINGTPVTNIKEGIFKDSNITSIKIGKNLKSIPKEAFANCPNLKKVVIPKNVKKIESKAFKNCPHLVKIILKKGILDIEKEAFANCPKLNKIKFPKSIISLDNNVFGKTSLKAQNSKTPLRRIYKKGKRAMRKIKKILKNIYRRIRYGKKIYVYKNIPILTVNELCRELGINVPKAYQEIKNIPIHETYLFDNLETKDKIRKNLKLKYFNKPKYFKKQELGFDRFKTRYRDANKVLKNTDEELIQMIIEWLYVFKPLGYYFHDYFDYELYNRTVEDAKTFLSRRYCLKVYKLCNDKKYIKYLRNKQLFNKKFSKYVNRSFLKAEAISFDEFKEFIKKHPKFFAKPLKGTGGYGSGIIDSKGQDLRELYNKCQEANYIIEGIVKQHKDLAKFNASTVNTIRIYSLLCADGKVRPLMGIFRAGRAGNDVDNFHCGGMAAAVDMKTGKISSNALNRDHLFFERHPDSNVKFKGFQIPCWDKVMKAVEDAGLSIPEVRHIGWDIAITDKGEVELIEGNCMPNFDAAQAADQIGKYHVYEKYINEIEKLKEEKSEK